MDMKLLMKASPSISSGSINYSIRPLSLLPPERRRMSCCRFQFATYRTPKPAIFSAQAVAAPDRRNRFDETNSYTLEGIRNSLIRQEDSIIFSLLERAQFCYNAETYDPFAFAVVGFQCSLAEHMVKETEKVHARVGRYDSLVEQPFFPAALPHSMLPPLCYPQTLFYPRGHFEYLEIVLQVSAILHDSEYIDIIKHGPLHVVFRDGVFYDEVQSPNFQQSEEKIGWYGFGVLISREKDSQ